MTDEGAGQANGSHRPRGHEQPEWTADDVDRASRRVMHLLGEQVPISLILDVSAQGGPDSEHLLTAEGGGDQTWWEPDASAPTAPASRTTRPS